MHDRYRGVYNERRVLFMNQADMKSRGLNRLDVVNLKSTYDGVERTALKFLVVPYDIPKGNCGAYFPETNSLIPIDAFADKSRTPISKSVRITVEKMP